MSSFTVVIPALNEEENLRAAVESVLKEIGPIGTFLEVLVFDDASTDGTGAIADALAAADERVRAFHNPRRLNIGGSYKAGVRMARGDYVFLVPGDNETRVDEIARGLQHLDGHDLMLFYVTNARVRGPFRLFLSGLYVTIVNAMFGTSFRYTNGTNVFRTKVVRDLTIETDGFAYQTEAVLRAVHGGVDYIQVGLEIKARDFGTSKAISWKNIRRVAESLGGLWWELRVRGRGATGDRGRCRGTW